MISLSQQHFNCCTGYQLKLTDSSIQTVRSDAPYITAGVHPI